MSSNNQFVLSPNGNFQTFTALNTVLIQLLNKVSGSVSGNIQGSTVEVRGINNISGGSNFNYSSLVKFVGNSGGFNFQGSATLNNIEFDNLTLTLAGTLTISNCIFNNCQITVNSVNGFNLLTNCQFLTCVITYTYDATSNGSFTVGHLSNPLQGCLLGTTSNSQTIIKDIKIKDCSFIANTGTANYFPFISFLVNGESHYLENIIINNNKFSNTNAGNDQRSIISFVSTLTANPTINQGPRITDIRINDNICDKNQLIIIAPTLGSDSPSPLIHNMLVPINVKIEGNTCGAICYMMRQDVPLTTTNSSKILDKENLITISKNNCKIIYSGFSTGFVDEAVSGNFNVAQVVSGHNIYSCSAIINQNTCSWLSPGVLNPTTYSFNTPKLEISGNKINAYITTFFNSYFNNTPTNVAINITSEIGT